MNIPHTPDTVAAPYGPYSHAVEVPGGSRLLYISGEIGRCSQTAWCLKESKRKLKLFGRTSSPYSKMQEWASAI